MIMTKVPQHPRPHNFALTFALGLESAVQNRATIVPIVVYHEGLGVINSYKSNPQNASFAEYAGAKCYPTSRVNNFFCEAIFSLSKEALETDKIHHLRFGTNQIFTSFMDGQLAEDEVSGLDLNEILELTNESTDRSTFPLFNNVTMKTYMSNATLDLEVAQEGLTTDLEIEGVTFSEDQYYDCLHYLTNGNKLKTIQSGLKWHTLTRQHPQMSIRWNQHPQTKYMNPYTFNGVFITLPSIGNSFNQIGKAGDTTDINHLEVSFRYRYNEFNHEFNHSLQ